MLPVAIEAARRAGREILSRHMAEHIVTAKGFRDIVTEADAAAEAAILGLLRAHFPDHAILSEESGGDEIGSGYMWVVDPLDGTINYARGVPAVCVSIGLLKDGQPLLGVIYDPLRDQMFTAERGAGAWLNGRPLRVSRTTRPEEIVVGVDWGRSDAMRRQMLRYLGRVLPHCATVRVLGSAALMLTYVAAGWLDVYFHVMLKPWDSAAATLIITEAGGRCTTLTGQPYHVTAADCLATNGLLHAEILALLAAASAG